jgi:hypothetical protein
MHKATLLYGYPADPDAFEKYYPYTPIKRETKDHSE